MFYDPGGAGRDYESLHNYSVVRQAMSDLLSDMLDNRHQVLVVREATPHGGRLMSVLSELKAARKRIENPENWIKGSFRVGQRYCLVGALTSVPYLDLTYKLLQRCVPKRYPTTKSKLAAYNDHPSTTHKDIMALFDKAIKLASCKNFGGTNG
jgi:hypothetical protein